MPLMGGATLFEAEHVPVQSDLLRRQCHSTSISELVDLLLGLSSEVERGRHVLPTLGK